MIGSLSLSMAKEKFFFLVLFITPEAPLMYAIFLFLLFFSVFFCLGLTMDKMQMWEGIIQKAKDGGLDVIETYVFWNLHEPSPGNVFDSFFLFKLFIVNIFLSNLFLVAVVLSSSEKHW